MGTVLLTWELGGGFGHVQRLQPLAAELAARGHRVFAVLREIRRAETIFRGTPVTFLRPPPRARAPQQQFRPTLSLAHVLHNACFGVAPAVAAAVAAWRDLFDSVRPDVAV